MMKTSLLAIVLGLSLLHAAIGCASNTEPAVVAIYSAYQSDIINHKTHKFVDFVSASLHRFTRIVTVASDDGLKQLLQKQRYTVVFMPSPWQPSRAGMKLTPIVQTVVPLGLYARAGKEDLADLKKVAIPASLDSKELGAELQQLNPDIAVITQPIGVVQLRTLVAGDADAVVMTTGLYNNLAPNLRSSYVLRHAFRHPQRIIAWCTTAFTPEERQLLLSAFTSLPADALQQLHETFGVTGFSSYVQ